MIAIIAQYTSDFQSEENGRFTEIAKYLNQIDSVELITSSFSHSLKQKKVCKILPTEYKLTFIDAPSYKKNISLQRLRSCKAFAKNIESYLNKTKEIKLIYCAVPSLDVGKVVINFCKRKKIPMILDIQDLWPDAFYMVFDIPVVSQVLFFPLKVMADNIYRNANNIVTVSNTYLERATTHLSHIADNSLVAYLGTSLMNFDKFSEGITKDTSTGNITIVYIGTLSYSYDINLVIHAIHNVQRISNLQINFLVMGDGPLKEHFYLEAKRSDVRARFTGRLNYPEMVKLLVSADIAVNPIVKKSAGSIINKVGDYAAAGLPVINSQECMEYRKLVEKYRCGINCKNGSTEDFTGALLWMINHPAEREEMGENARRMAEELFDRDKSYQTIQRFVRKIYESSDN